MSGRSSRHRAPLHDSTAHQPADQAALQKSAEAWHLALTQYNDDIFEYSSQNTDCVGQLPTTAHLGRFGLKAPVCRPQTNAD